MGERITPSNLLRPARHHSLPQRRPSSSPRCSHRTRRQPRRHLRAPPTLTVKPDSTSVSLDVSTKVDVGQSTTYTATVTPPASRPGPIEPQARLSSSMTVTPIAACLRQALVNGGATCTRRLQGAQHAQHHARYGGDSNFIGSTASAQTHQCRPVPVHVLGIVTSTMQWTFSLHACLHEGPLTRRQRRVRRRDRARQVPRPRLPVRQAHNRGRENQALWAQRKAQMSDRWEHGPRARFRSAPSARRERRSRS